MSSLEAFSLPAIAFLISAGVAHSIGRLKLVNKAVESAIAVKGLAMAVALSTALFTSFGLPIEWATPAEVKKAIAGKENASKEDIMLAVCKKYGWKITEKPVYSKTTKKVQRIDKTYHPIGKSVGKNLFEHIADSLGAFEALKHTNIARVFLKK